MEFGDFGQKSIDYWSNSPNSNLLPVVRDTRVVSSTDKALCGCVRGPGTQAYFTNDEELVVTKAGISLRDVTMRATAVKAFAADLSDVKNMNWKLAFSGTFSEAGAVSNHSHAGGSGSQTYVNLAHFAPPALHLH